MKGYAQRYGIDCSDVFDTMAMFEKIIFLLAIAIYYGWEVHHLKVKSTLVNGEILEDIHVSSPGDMKCQIKNNEYIN